MTDSPVILCVPLVFLHLENQYIDLVFAVEAAVSNVAMNITLSQVPLLKPNQLVNATATISLGNDPPKEVYIKRSGETLKVKEDCIGDDTGKAVINLWQPFFVELERGKTYSFKNMCVKLFKGSSHLATQLDTTYKEVQQHIT